MMAMLERLIANATYADLLALKELVHKCALRVNRAIRQHKEHVHNFSTGVCVCGSVGDRW